MRGEVTAADVRRLMVELGYALRQETTVYLVGGTSAVLFGWRASTIDIDLKIVPDSEAYPVLARLKETLEVNIELASPLDFLPPLPGWHERSRFIAREGKVSFHHFDFCSQALSKIERGFEKDMDDVREMVRRGLVEPAKTLELYRAIEPLLVRFPAIDAETFRRSIEEALAPPAGSG
jgi:uncharacterized nucleotidyltransferase DUF6036